MRTYELCRDCIHFEHECAEDICFEKCNNPNISTEFFYDTETIVECEGFEKANYKWVY